MCIFNAPVKRVNNTRIFVCSDGRRQLTLYGNQVLLEGKSIQNAMILPVPGPASEIVVDLPLNSKEARADVDHLFQLLQAPFEETSPYATNSSSSRAAAKSFLEVKQIGSYKVSLAPSVEDLARYDPGSFRVDAGVLSVLRARYRAGFCFLICQLHDSKPYHPFAYMHRVAVTPASQPQLFVPTLHVHGGPKRAHMRRSLLLDRSSVQTNAHAQGGDGAADTTDASATVALEDVSRDWDHQIYAVCQARTRFAAHVWDTQNQGRTLSPLIALDNLQMDEARIETARVGSLLRKHTNASSAAWLASIFDDPSGWATVAKFSCQGVAPNGDLLLVLQDMPPMVQSAPRSPSLSLSSRSPRRSHDNSYEGVCCCCKNPIPMNAVKYRCLHCTDLDICGACVGGSRHLAPSAFVDRPTHTIQHVLCRLELPQQLATQLNKPKANAHGVSCSQCRAPIVGLRYTCTQCNVHLCSQCDVYSTHWPHGVIRYA